MLKLLLTKNPLPESASAVATIGNFDGVHLGHQELIKSVVSIAKKTNRQSLVISFEPTVSSHMARKRGTPLLQLGDLRHKIHTLSMLGVDTVVLFAPNSSLFNISADTFIHEYLIAKLSIAHLVVGRDFRFGYQREGTVELLQEYDALTVEVVDDFYCHQHRVSSSLIRRCLISGDVELATTLLGHYWCRHGKIVRGDGIGRQLGYPTINIQGKNFNAWPLGVYVGRVTIHGNVYQAAVSIGTRPTVSNKGYVVCEAHLLDTSDNFYGYVCQLEITAKIREQSHFANREQLIVAIKNDCLIVQQWFNSH